MRIYTWPVRFALVGTSAFAALAYISVLISDLRGQNIGAAVTRPTPQPVPEQT